jgi:hypothetical protein
MTTRLEQWTYRIVLGISVFLVVVLGWAVLFFWEMDGYQDRLLAQVEANGQRIAAMEQGRVQATAKRYTSDDSKDMILCLKLRDKAESDECLDRFQARFSPKE